MRHSLRHAAAMVLLAWCARETFAQSTHIDRQFLPVNWKKSVVVEGSLDSDLLRPLLMIARDSSIYVYDYGDQSLKAFSVLGPLRWRFGRSGQGPGEFGNPTDIQLDPSGNLWIADPQTSRITVVSNGGKLLRTIPQSSMVERVVPLAAGQFLSFAFSGDKPRFERKDSTGRAMGAILYPAWMDSTPSLVSELRTAVSSDGINIFLGSFYSGRMLRLRGGDSVVKEMITVETHAFPKPISYSPNKNMTVRRLPPDARPTIRSISADAKFAYALILGSGDERGRIVDLYRTADGLYAGSWILPERAIAISVTPRGVAALVSDELPSLYFYEAKRTGQRHLDSRN